MAWDDNQTNSDDITSTEWNQMVDVIKTQGVSATDYTGTTGGDQIQAALDDANNNVGGYNVVVVGPNGPDDVSASTGSTNTNAWELTAPLQIPSNTVLVLNNAYLFLSDSTSDNLIRNASADSGDATRNNDIYIIGQGNAELDGNAGNQSNLEGSSTAYLNHGIHLYKVDNFSIRNLKLVDTEKFAVVSEDAYDGVIQNIDIDQKGNGSNQDGVHVMGPGNNITVSEISGTVGDDFLAADADGSSTNDTRGFARGSGGLLENVFFENCVHDNLGDTSSLLRTVASSTATLDGVYMRNCARKGSPNCQLFKLGWNNIGSSASAQKNIHIENVKGAQSGGDTVLIDDQSCGITNLTIDGLEAECAYRVTDLNNGTEYKNVKIKNFDITVTADHAGFALKQPITGLKLENGRLVNTATSTLDGISYSGSGTTGEFVHIENVYFEGWDEAIYLTSQPTYNVRPRIKDCEFSNTGTNKYNLEIDGVVINGLATESANAETPQLGYEVGDIVDFTDGGDGSGTAKYIKTQDETFESI